MLWQHETHLEPLVHHRGTTQRDLRPHVPVGMCRRLRLHDPLVGLAHAEQFLLRQVPERPPRRRQDYVIFRKVLVN